MVNGPVSGGEFPLGKEYWENQEDNKGYEYDPSKNVPKKTINVPVGQTQQGEAMQKVENKFSKKEIAKLLVKYSIDQKDIAKILARNGESVKVAAEAGNSLEHIELLPEQKNVDILEKIIQNIPADIMEGLKTKADIIKYIKDHPELKQSIELVNDSSEETPEATDKPEGEAEQKVVLDLTTQFEDGEKVYYAKDPSRGEDGWYKIDKEKYDEIYNKYYKAKESPDGQNV